MPCRGEISSATVRRAFALVSLTAVACVSEGAVPAKPEPRITSVNPAVATAGSSVTLRIRGMKLDHPLALWSPAGGVQCTSVRYKPAGSPTEGDGWLEADVAISAGAPAGSQAIRVITKDGLSNPLPLEITGERVHDESFAADLTPGVIAGTLSKPGEVDTWWLTASAGETWTFEAKAGAPTIDLSLGLYQPSGSWFDPHRLNRIAFNDEPLHFPGLSSSPRLVHRFQQNGRYAVSVSGFAGQGGPDAVYFVKVTRGITAEPVLHPETDPAWEERQFTRTLTSDWPRRIGLRGAPAGSLSGEVESWATADAESAEIPAVPVPAIVHGSIAKPAATQAVNVRVEKPGDLVIEIETPKATLPRFNPVVRLLDGAGNELVTNVYTKRNNNGLYMMKMIQSKATVALRSPGLYRLEIRDITTDCAGEDFEYKVSVRPSTPHLGKVLLSESQINLRPGGVTELHLTAEREEEFAGTVAFEVDGLPRGVSAVSALANPVEKPPLPNGGKVERYTPRSQTSVLLLTAAADAVHTDRPVLVRVFVRPVAEGKLGDRILVRELPLFVATGGSS